MEGTYLRQGDTLTCKDTGEMFKHPLKKQRHGLAEPDSIIDCKDALRDYSLKRGIKGTSTFRFNGGLLHDSLESFRNREEEKLTILNILLKVDYMNIVFLSRDELQSILKKSPKNLSRHLSRLAELGILKTTWESTSSLYKVEVNPTIFFKGDHDMQSVKTDIWYSADKTVSPLVSEESIQKALYNTSLVSLKEATSAYEQSIGRSRVRTTSDTRSNKALQCNEIEFAILQCERRIGHLQKS